MKIWLACDDYYQPAINVPHYRIVRVELDRSAFEQAQYDKMWASMSQFHGKGGGTTSVAGCGKHHRCSETTTNERTDSSGDYWTE
jgi:hypothetical protein